MSHHAVVEVHSLDRVRYSLYSRNGMCSGMQEHEELLCRISDIGGVTVVEVLAYTVIVEVDRKFDWSKIEAEILRIVSPYLRWWDKQIDIVRHISPPEDNLLQ